MSEHGRVHDGRGCGCARDGGVHDHGNDRDCGHAYVLFHEYAHLNGHESGHRDHVCDHGDHAFHLNAHACDRDHDDGRFPISPFLHEYDQLMPIINLQLFLHAYDHHEWLVQSSLVSLVLT